jgi:hypothetical protein
VTGRRLHQWIAFAEDAGVRVHLGWRACDSANAKVRIEFEFAYFVPDAAWNARPSINSPADGGPYGPDRVRLRDRDWGALPARFLVPVEALLALVPGEHLSLDQEVGVASPTVHYLETTPITYGYSEHVSATFDIARGEASPIVKLLKSGITWDGRIDVCSSGTLHYLREPWNLSCVQRIFSVQQVQAVAANLSVVGRADPSLVRPGRRRRRTMRSGAHK